MSFSEDLFGEKLVNENGEVEATSVAGDGKVIGLYFSAHWCPPCRAFTPQLAEWYKKFKDTHPHGDKLEIVFISSDRDEGTFKEYFGEMPWLALPYVEREKKGDLSRKFKVTGIPTLVFIDGKTGKLVTTDGRAIVMEDPEGKDFPWTPKSFGELISGKFTNKEGEEKNWTDVKEDVIGLYFSAHWCGPCRIFTPQLAKTYKKLKEDGKSVEIIFASSDRDKEAMKDYLSEMPWLAIPHGDSRKKSLTRLYDVSGIPTLVFLKRDGELITTQGRGAIAQDPDGKGFPWYPKPANLLNGLTAGDINDHPSLIWFMKEVAENAVKILTDVAEKHIQDYKGMGDDERVHFFYHSDDKDEDDVGNSLKSFANLPSETPLLVLLDIPNQRVHINTEKKIDAELLKKVSSDYKENKLDMTPLRQQ